jgi:hypothetical protein
VPSSPPAFSLILSQQRDPDREHLCERCFRRGGATIAEAVAAHQQLTTDGIVATAAEMELLKRRLDNGRKLAG